MTTDSAPRSMKPEDLIAWANTLSNNPETPGGARSCLEQIAEALGDAIRDSRRFEGYARDRLAIAVERDEARADYESLEEDAARVVLAYLHGDKIELDETIGKMMGNGREKWWEAHRPAGLRGEGATP